MPLGLLKYGKQPTVFCQICWQRDDENNKPKLILRFAIFLPTEMARYSVEKPPVKHLYLRFPP